MLAGVLADCFHEAFPIARKLRLANSADSSKLVQCGGTFLGHLTQRGIVEDHIGRQTLFVSQVFAQHTQVLEKSGVLATERDVCRRATLLPCRRGGPGGAGGLPGLTALP